MPNLELYKDAILTVDLPAEGLRQAMSAQWSSVIKCRVVRKSVTASNSSI